MDTNEILTEIEILLKNKNFKKALEKANEITEPSLFEKIGYLFKQYAQWGNAINFFSKTLKHQPNNKTILHEKTFLIKILKLEQLDIFASTNLNKDPWLE